MYNQLKLFRNGKNVSKRRRWRWWWFELLATFVTSLQPWLPFHCCKKIQKYRWTPCLHILCVWNKNDDNNCFILMSKVGDGSAELAVRRRFRPLLWRHYSHDYHSIVAKKFRNIDEHLVCTFSVFEIKMMIITVLF